MWDREKSRPCVAGKGSRGIGRRAGCCRYGLSMCSDTGRMPVYALVTRLAAPKPMEPAANEQPDDDACGLLAGRYHGQRSVLADRPGAVTDQVGEPKADQPDGLLVGQRGLRIGRRGRGSALRGGGANVRCAPVLINESGAGAFLRGRGANKKRNREGSALYNL